MPLKFLLQVLAVEYFAGEYTQVPKKVDIVTGYRRDSRCSRGLLLMRF